jgi:hypothetical protein
LCGCKLDSSSVSSSSWLGARGGLAIHCFLVHFINALISVDLILILLVRVLNLSNLIIFVHEVAQCCEISWNLGILR